jgi:hypothetical protein
VNILFPLPFISLLLLCLPLPAFLSTSIHRFLTKILDVLLLSKIGGSINLYQIAVTASSILFVLTAYDTMKMTEKEGAAKADMLSFKSEER